MRSKYFQYEKAFSYEKAFFNIEEDKIVLQSSHKCLNINIFCLSKRKLMVKNTPTDSQSVSSTC